MGSYNLRQFYCVYTQQAQHLLAGKTQMLTFVDLKSEKKTFQVLECSPKKMVNTLKQY